MLSMFGYFVQYDDISQAPVENWATHIADPFAVNGLTLEITTQYTLSPSVAMFAAAGNKKTAAGPRVDLTGWYGPDCKTWLGPNTADSYGHDYFAVEYPGGYNWDGAGHAADPKTFERLRVAEVHYNLLALCTTRTLFTHSAFGQPFRMLSCFA